MMETKVIETRATQAYEYAWGQGLAYIWGRYDAGERDCTSARAVGFADYWARLCASGTSRRSIQGEYEAWKEAQR